jgi:hypothetical protein
MERLHKGQIYLISGSYVTIDGLWVRGNEVVMVDVSFRGVKKTLTIEEFNSKDRILIV